MMRFLSTDDIKIINKMLANKKRVMIKWRDDITRDVYVGIVYFASERAGLIVTTDEHCVVANIDKLIEIREV